MAAHSVLADVGEKGWAQESAVPPKNPSTGQFHEIVVSVATQRQ